ncbi:MAG: hypothetical protein ACKN9E_18145 [Microcystaceae cyanobacterium]
MTETIQLTAEQLAKYRVELADNPGFLAALDVIEEWDGDLADAAESLATLNGIEGVEDNADLRWFVILLQKCRGYICQPKYEKLREKYLPALIPPLTDFIAGAFMCPPGIAGILSAPIALYIQEEGMDKFCQVSPDD